jgi:hypothetical protein
MLHMSIAPTAELFAILFSRKRFKESHSWTYRSRNTEADADANLQIVEPMEVFGSSI